MFFVRNTIVGSVPEHDFLKQSLGRFTLPFNGNEKANISAPVLELTNPLQEEANKQAVNIKILNDKIDVELSRSKSLVSRSKSLEDSNRFLKSMVEDLSQRLIEKESRLEAMDKMLGLRNEQFMLSDSETLYLKQKIEEQELSLKWYKSTYENRSLFGVIKEKLLKK